MEQRIIEGTWEEILLHAPELAGQRVRLTVLSNQNTTLQDAVDLAHILEGSEAVEIAAEHKGLAFLLNQSYQPSMSELELFEATRGTWHNIPRDESIKFAYATYGGIIKEVYEIHGWVKAGTQQYFTRFFDDNGISDRWEFIGRKASSDVRQKYLGKLIKKDRSYGTPFVKVGY